MFNCYYNTSSVYCQLYRKIWDIFGVLTAGRVLVLIQVAALRAASQAHAPRSHGMKQPAYGGMRSKDVAARSNDAGGGGSRARRGASLALTRLPNPRILRRPCIRDIHPAIPLRISLPSVAVQSFPFRPVRHIPPRPSS